MIAGKLTRTVLLAAVFAICVSTPSMAQVGAEGGSGLFMVDKAKTLGHMNFAVSAFYWSANWDNAGVDMNQSTISVPVTVGIGDSLEISAQLPSTRLSPDGADSTDGVSDGIAKVKWDFFDSEKHNLRLAVIGLVTLPFGDKNKGLGTGDTDVGAKLAIDKEYENITWHFNLGYLNHKSDNLDSVAIYGAGFEWFALENLGVIGEVSGKSWSKQAPWRDDNTMTLVGARYYVSDWANLSAGYASWNGGSGSGSPNYMWTAGVTVGLGIGRHQTGGGGYASTPPAQATTAPAPTAAPAAPTATAPPARTEPANVVITLENVHFMLNSDKLTPSARDILSKNAEQMKSNPSAQLVIEGHTCSIGSSGYNYKLGVQRAKAVKLFLARELGLDPDRMFVISYGEDKPVSSNETDDGRKLNRRVDFVIQVH